MNDPFAVPCPTCLAHIGEPCCNRTKRLDFAHWARRRIAHRRSVEHARRASVREAHPSSSRSFGTT